MEFIAKNPSLFFLLNNPKKESIQGDDNFSKHKIASLKNRLRSRSKFNEKQRNPFHFRCFRFFEFFAVRASAIPSTRRFRGFVQRRKRVQQPPSSNFSSGSGLGRFIRRPEKIHRGSANHNLLLRFLNFLGCGRLGGGFRRAFYTSRRRRRRGGSLLFRVLFLPVKTTQANAGNNGKCGETAHNGFLCLKTARWTKSSPKSNPIKVRLCFRWPEGKPHSIRQQREKFPP